MESNQGCPLRAVQAKKEAQRQAQSKSGRVHKESTGSERLTRTRKPINVTTKCISVSVMLGNPCSSSSAGR